MILENAVGNIRILHGASGGPGGPRRKPRGNDRKGRTETSGVRLLGFTQKMNHQTIREYPTGYHFRLQFSVALLALRFLRGDVLLSQLRDFR